MAAESKYKPEYAEQAKKLCLLLGATNAKLAAFFGVSDVTIDNWLVKHEDFREAVHFGKNVADSEVAMSTYQRARGYSHPETKVHFTMGPDGKVIAHREEITKHYPPDTGAAAFWLKNRQGWRDKVELTGGGPNGELALLVVYEDEDPPEPGAATPDPGSDERDSEDGSREI